MTRPEKFDQVACSASRISIQNVSKSFDGKDGPVRILDNLNIEVEPGEMLVLLGPSGCGKTTLLRSIAGLERPDGGRILVDDSPLFSADERIFLPPHRRGVGMVFQNYALWPHMTVQQNVQFPLDAKKVGHSVSVQRARKALEIVQCGHLADRYPPQLSGGQQQRVSLARAIASQPRVLLLDEPLSNLDALLRHELRTQIRQIHRELNFTGVYVTHDQIEAMNLASKVIVLNKGRIAQAGLPDDIYHRPQNEFVAEFLGLRNRLACTLAGGRISSAEHKIVSDGVALSEGEYILRFRPSAVSIHREAEGTIEAGRYLSLQGGKIVEVLHSGETIDYVLESNGTLFYAESRSKQSFARGERVTAQLHLSDARFFAAQSGELAHG